MNGDRKNHLSEDQLIVAVVDESDLPHRLREHFTACPKCRADGARLERDLSHIGRIAERFAPAPGRNRFRVVPEKRDADYRIRRRQTALGMLLAMAVLLLVLWWPGPSGITLEPGADPSLRETQEAEKLMAEIDQLTENALPAVYMKIIAETHTVFDEAFIQFVIPPVNGEPVSGGNRLTKGVVSC